MDAATVSVRCVRIGGLRVTEDPFIFTRATGNHFMSESKPDISYFGVFTLMWCGFVFGASISKIATQHMTTNSVRNDAINAGAGRYVCDPETGKVTFEWVTK